MRRGSAAPSRSPSRLAAAGEHDARAAATDHRRPVPVVGTQRVRAARPRPAGCRSSRRRPAQPVGRQDRPPAPRRRSPAAPAAPREAVRRGWRRCPRRRPATPVSAVVRGAIAPPSRAGGQRAMRRATCSSALVRPVRGPPTTRGARHRSPRAVSAAGVQRPAPRQRGDAVAPLGRGQVVGLHDGGHHLDTRRRARTRGHVEERRRARRHQLRRQSAGRVDQASGHDAGYGRAGHAQQRRVVGVVEVRSRHRRGHRARNAVGTAAACSTVATMVMPA